MEYNGSLLVPQIQQQIDDDINKRTEIHKANIVRLKSSLDSAKNLLTEVFNKPLVMLAIGDSWFDYPLTGNGLPLSDTDVIAQLRRIGDMPPTILNLAHHGDAATEEMSLPKQERIIAALNDKTNWMDGEPDAILFSAGGNDIAGNQFCIFLDFNDGNVQGLNQVRFEKAIGMVEACYLDLFSLRDRIAPGVPIIGHCYDFPIPNGSHPICAGPWLKPSLDFCNWPVAQGTQILKTAMLAFQKMLDGLSKNKENNFYLINTQGTLTPAEWANELHPTPKGFRKIATSFSEFISTNL